MVVRGRVEYVGIRFGRPPQRLRRIRSLCIAIVGRFSPVFDVDKIRRSNWTSVQHCSDLRFSLSTVAPTKTLRSARLPPCSVICGTAAYADAHRLAVTGPSNRRSSCYPGRTRGVYRFQRGKRKDSGVCGAQSMRLLINFRRWCSRGSIGASSASVGMECSIIVREAPGRSYRHSVPKSSDLRRCLQCHPTSNNLRNGRIFVS